MFFKKKNKVLNISDQIICVWSPAGSNSAKISWSLANCLAEHTSVALVELPCLGIPRLAVEANLLDRTHNTDFALLEYDRKGQSPINFSHRVNDNLLVLPANGYTLPDHPVVQKLTHLQNLNNFPSHFGKEARKKGFSVIIYDCQGSLVSPMTYFSLTQATKIIMVVDGPAEISWSLNNMERMVDIYNFKPSVFLGTTVTISETYHQDIEKVLKCPVRKVDALLPFLADQPGEKSFGRETDNQSNKDQEINNLKDNNLKADKLGVSYIPDNNQEAYNQVADYKSTYNSDANPVEVKKKKVI